MNARNWVRGERLTRLLLFLGFSGLVGCLGTTWFFFILAHQSPVWHLVPASGGLAGLNLPRSMSILNACLTQSSFFLPLTALGLAWGSIRLRENADRRTIVLGTLRLAILLAPLVVGTGTLLILTTMRP